MYDHCRHIRVNGARCNGMAVNGKAFCYFHLHNRRKPAAKPAKSDTADYGAILVHAPSAQVALHVELPLLEDRHAIQVSITQIVHALAANEIDPKRASLLLYALQIASANLRDDRYLFPNNIRRVVRTESGDQIAPAETIFEKEDLSGHKKSCRCDQCTFVQEDSEAHHSECTCGDCDSSVAQAPAAESAAEPAVPSVESTANDEISLQASAESCIHRIAVKRKMPPFPHGSRAERLRAV